MMKYFLFATAVFLTVITSCSPHKKIVVLTPSPSSNNEIVYKTVTDSINKQAAASLLKALKNIHDGFFLSELPASALFCGPFLWNQINSLIAPQDSIGISTTVLIPENDPNEKQKMRSMKARVIKNTPDLNRLWGTMYSFLNQPDSFSIRKLTEPEKSVYWSIISWDIEEPVFIVEINGKTLLFDLMAKNDVWTLFYLDDFTQIIDKANASHAISESQKKTFEMAKADNIAGAESEALKSLEESEKLYGKRHKKYGVALVALGNVYWQQSNIEKAESLYVKAAAVFLDALGPENSYLANLYNNLAGLYSCQGKYNEAELSLKKGLHILQKMFGPEDKGVAITYSTLATIYKDKKEYVKALETHRMTLSLFEKNFGKDNPNMAIAYSNQGECYFAMKNYLAADTCYRKAENILLQSLGSDHSFTIDLRANVGRNLVYLKRYADAEPFLLKAIEVRLKKVDKINRSLLEPVESLGKLYRETNNIPKADEYDNWAKEIAEKTTPESNCNVVPME